MNHSVSELFAAALPSLGSVADDLYVAATCLVGISILAAGVLLIKAILTGETVVLGKDQGDSTLDEYAEYERNRYKKELFERTYKTRQEKYGPGGLNDGL